MKPLKKIITFCLAITTLSATAWEYIPQSQKSAMVIFINGKKYFVISPHDEFERFFGREADKRRKLYNGMIRCQYYQYYAPKK